MNGISVVFNVANVKIGKKGKWNLMIAYWKNTFLMN